MVAILDNKPWYTYFWPWFLITILGASIIGSLMMLYTAISSDDGVVKDNYYKEGLAINQQLDHDKKAHALGLQAEIDTTDSHTLKVTLFHQKDFVLPKTMRIDFIYPTRADHDQIITLTHAQQNTYTATLTQPLTGHWYMQVLPPDNSWRLIGEVFLPDQRVILLSPHI